MHKSGPPDGEIRVDVGQEDQCDKRAYTVVGHRHCGEVLAQEQISIGFQDLGQVQLGAGHGSAVVRAGKVGVYGEGRSQQPFPVEGAGAPVVEVDFILLQKTKEQYRAVQRNQIDQERTGKESLFQFHNIHTLHKRHWVARHTEPALLPIRVDIEFTEAVAHVFAKKRGFALSKGAVSFLNKFPDSREVIATCAALGLPDGPHRTIGFDSFFFLARHTAGRSRLGQGLEGGSILFFIRGSHQARHIVRAAGVYKAGQFVRFL
mmetsp:Transcript_13123/g.37246  ORF Transcript_13123/g.37246 Transcript_13123/m.37246 type:complete len:262 (-) Transcript_13123:1335-2120(-)